MHPSNERRADSNLCAPTQQARSRVLVITVAGVIAILAVLWTSLRPSRSREVSVFNLERRDGVLFVRGETTPFTGEMVERYKDGSPKSRSRVAKGLLHGRSEAWSTHGTLQVREFFRRGISHGLRTKWHDNGAKMSEAMIVNGKLEGTFRRWHENGRLAEQIELRQGQPDGLSLAFHPSGFVKAQAWLRMGEVIDQKFWNDGEIEIPPATSETAGQK